MSKESRLFVAIVQANPGIVAQNTEMQDICREVWRDTGVIIGAKQTLDYYDHDYQRDYDGEPRQMFRVNRRKFSLNIKGHA